MFIDMELDELSVLYQRLEDLMGIIVLLKGKLIYQ